MHVHTHSVIASCLGQTALHFLRLQALCQLSCPEIGIKEGVHAHHTQHLKLIPLPHTSDDENLTRINDNWKLQYYTELAAQQLAALHKQSQKG